MSTSVAWEHELQSWLERFLTHLHPTARRRMCPLYGAGLIGGIGYLPPTGQQAVILPP
jgi:hypothetical protein